jgi:Family of unknown function (DUF6090)
MNQNRSKYFRYAIGEIVLVVVGILIALSINNWNETRQNKQQAQKYMKGLIDDLKSDSIQYQISIRAYQSDIRHNSTIFLNDDFENIQFDTLNRHLDQFYMVDRLTDYTFQKIKNSGLTDLIGSGKTNKAINDYYSITSAHYKEFLNYDKELLIKELNYWLYNSNYEASISTYAISKSLPFQENETQRKKKLIKLINSTMGRNNLRNAIARKELGIIVTNRSLDATTALIEMIQSDLSN